MKPTAIAKSLFKSLESHKISERRSMDIDPDHISYSGSFKKLDCQITRFKCLKRHSNINVLVFKEIKCAIIKIESQLYVPYKVIRDAAYVANKINHNLFLGALHVKSSGHIVYECRVFFSSKRINKIIKLQIIKSIKHAFATEQLNEFTNLIDCEVLEGHSVF